MSAVPDPEVSVVIGVRNGAATLQRCLDSIAAQDFASRETIVVDGASTDGTRELVERNAREGKVDDFISEPDHGIYEAWNKAIRSTYRTPGRCIAAIMLGEHGLFDESYQNAGDYELLLGELLERPPVFLNRVVLDMGFGGMSSRPGAQAAGRSRLPAPRRSIPRGARPAEDLERLSVA